MADFTAVAIVDACRQNNKTNYQVLETKRFKLGTSYPKIVVSIKELDERIRIKLPGVAPVFVVETNGVGEPVVQMLKETLPRSKIYEVFTTGGENVTKDGSKISAGKKRMVTNLSAMLSVGRLKLSKENTALINELQNFKGFQLESGKEEFEAKTGAHDDLIMALCFVVLCGEHVMKHYFVPIVLPTINWTKNKWKI